MTYGNIESDGDTGLTYTGGYVTCPNCGEDAELHIWGEGVDATIKCTNTDCDATPDRIR